MLLNPYRYGTGGGGATDPHFSLVSALLHFDGANGSTTLTDQKGGTWTPSGNAQLTTTSPIVGSASLLLDGNGDYITHASDAKFAFGTGDFCIEFDYAPDDVTGNKNLVTWGANWNIYQGGAGVIVWDGSGNLNLTTGGLAIGIRTRIALSRIGTSLKLYLDGVSVGGVATDSTSHAAAPFYVGFYPSSSSWPAGRFDELRITKGHGRYPSDYTPDAGAFPDS